MTTTNGTTADHAAPTLPDPTTRKHYQPSTLAVHADDALNNTPDVSPALHVSTTFRYSRDPSALRPASDDASARAAPPHADAHIYSRESAPNTSRLEHVLTALLGAPCLTYSSGLAAFHALLTFLHPRAVAIGAGYHGSHGVLRLYQKLTRCAIVDLFDDASWDAAALGPGDVVHLETPVNPSGVAYDIRRFADLAHARGALLTVDATFGPPPLQDPLACGADFVMHSGTKYFGGHSDMLCGVIAVGGGRDEAYRGLFAERVYLGSVMGSLEGWLGVRSLRTLELRVVRQSESATRLVAALQGMLGGVDGGVGAEAVRRTVASIQHASLQTEDMAWLRKQMPGGFGPVFAIVMKTPALARRLPSKVELFHHATSLGGVESLIEWRRMSDTTVEEALLRVSIGVEDWEDLRDDLVEGFKALAEEADGSS